MASRLVDALSNIDSDLGPGRGYTYTIVAIQDHQRSTPAQVLLCTPGDRPASTVPTISVDNHIELLAHAFDIYT